MDVDGLPPGWESDYDGTRWLYRYAPTGRMQFNFPNPGDEFPQFDAPGAGRIALTPDDRLAYELQLKWQKEGKFGQGSTIPRKGKVGTKDDNFGTKTASGYFDPSGFMYLGEGLSDGELTPVADKKDAILEFPSGIAELATDDTLLCAEELAPIELDASPLQSVVAVARNVSKASLTTDSSGSEPRPNPSMALSRPQVPGTSPAHEEDIYSATPVDRHPEVQPLFAQEQPRQESLPSTGQATATQAFPVTPRLLFTPISSPIKTGGRNAEQPYAMGRPHPLALPGRSVDDIQTVPNSLQLHGPSNSRARSNTTGNPPWTPTIRFVQTGQLQESKVTVSPGASPRVLALQQRSPLALQQSSPLNKVSEWLHRQSFVGSSSDPSDTAEPAKAPSQMPPPVVVEAARKLVQDQASAGRASPQPKPTKDETRPVSRSKHQSPPVAVRNSPRSSSPNKLYNGPDDRVVESIIEVPTTSRMGGSRGVQLKDLIPGHARKESATKGNDERQRKRHFSWDDDIVSPVGKTTKDTTSALDSMTKIPKKPVITPAQASHRSRNVVVHHTPRSSPVPSPSLLMAGHLSPGHAQKGVLVEHTIVQPCTATMETATMETATMETASTETFPPKVLPPLPLGKRRSPEMDLVLQQPKANAFEQISELIAVANAAMPSARRLTAMESMLLPGPGWHSPDRETSRSAPGSPDQLTARPFPPPTAAQHLNVRPAHKRSVSQEDPTILGFKPSTRQHNRSQSLASRLNPTSKFAAPFGSGPSSVTLNADTVVLPKLAQAERTDGYKSHARPLTHLAAGSFPYHSLRSSQLIAPASHGEVDIDALSLDLDVDLTPKPSLDPIPQATKATQRPPLQLKVPFYPGLPSSPRPSPMFKPKLSPRVAVFGPNEEPSTSKTTTVEETKSHVSGPSTSTTAMGADTINDERKMLGSDKVADTTTFSSPVSRRPSESTVSSPTSSIFSSLRDSSVSAISAASSLADSYSSPLADLTAEMVPLETSQAQLVRRHRRTVPHSPSTGVDQMPIKPAHRLALTSPPVFDFSTVSSPAKIAPPQPTGVSTPVQRPKNISKWIRPAGTPASSPIVASKLHEVAPVRPPVTVPTVIVRAPTVKLRVPPTAPSGRKSSIARPPPSSTESAPPATPQVVVGDEAVEVIEKTKHVVDVVTKSSRTVTAPPVAEVVDMPSTPPLTPNDLVLGSPLSPLFDPLAFASVPQPVDIASGPSQAPPVFVAVNTSDSADTPPVVRPVASATASLPPPAPTEILLPVIVSPVPIELEPVEMEPVKDLPPVAEHMEMRPAPPVMPRSAGISLPATITTMAIEMPPVMASPPVVDTMNTGESAATSRTTDSANSHNHVFKKSPMTKVLPPTERTPDECPSSPAQSFLQSIRNSWRTSTFSMSRVTLTPTACQDSHIRATSQSTLPAPEPHGLMAEALTTANKHQAEDIAAWRQSRENKDLWPTRDSVTVIEDSISNVGAAIRFFNASWGSLRPKSETALSSPVALSESEGEGNLSSPNKLDTAAKFKGADIMATAVTVVRRRGPPVVVRISAMQA